jgi:hypothetical protein
MFWRLRHTAPSPALEHIPFLFWLLADIAPERIGTVTLPGAVLHFAACQGVERMGLKTTVHGRLLGNETDLARARRIEATHYEIFSRIARAEPRPAPPTLRSDKGIDLLLVEDAALLDMRTLLDDWADVLAEDAVALICNTSALEAEALERLIDGRTVLEFPHGSGALCVAAGRLGGRSGRMSELEPDSVAASEMRSAFAWLGQIHSAELRSGGAAETRPERRFTQAEVKVREDALRREMQALQDELDTARRATETLDAALEDQRTAFQQVVLAMTERLEAKTEDVIEMRRTVADLRRELERREDFDRLYARVVAQTKEIESLRKALADTRWEEGAAGDPAAARFDPAPRTLRPGAASAAGAQTGAEPRPGAEARDAVRPESDAAAASGGAADTNDRVTETTGASEEAEPDPRAEETAFGPSGSA